MFDYFHVTEVWVNFWWRDKTMAWFRGQFCDPTESANNECAVPKFNRSTDEMVRIGKSNTQHKSKRLRQLSLLKVIIFLLFCLF
jgi:hypothetical protein